MAGCTENFEVNLLRRIACEEPALQFFGDALFLLDVRVGAGSFPARFPVETEGTERKDKEEKAHQCGGRQSEGEMQLLTEA